MRHVKGITRNRPTEAQAGLSTIQIIQLVLPILLQLIQPFVDVKSGDDEGTA